MIALVEEAQKTKFQTQRLADKDAKWLTFISISVGILTFIAWLRVGKDIALALKRMVTVMVIFCPHAFGLAVSLVIAISMTISARNGLLIRNRTASENARKITALVFNKTDTLTKGEFGVQRIISFHSNWTETHILAYAASLEQHSEHPIVQGIIKAAKGKEIEIPQSENFQALTGKGIRGTINGKEWLLVSPSFLKENQIPIPESLNEDDFAETKVFLLQEKHLIGFIGLSDEIRLNHLRLYFDSKKWVSR